MEPGHNFAGPTEFMTDDRLILTFATGKKQFITMAKALAISLDLQMCDAPRAVITDSDDPELAKLYDYVIRPVPGYEHWFIKLCGLEVTQAKRILFLDSDCLAVRHLDKIWETFEGHDFAVQGLWRSELQWYGDMTSVIRKMNLPQIPVFSGGFLYYERSENTENLFKRVFEHRDNYDNLGVQRNGGHVVDEVCISFAMAQLGVGTVFPDSLDFSVTPWGLTGHMALDVFKGECHFMKGLDKPRLRRPMLYHTAHANADLRYWMQVRKLLKMYRRAQTGPIDGLRKNRKPMRALTELYLKFFKG